MLNATRIPALAAAALIVSAAPAAAWDHPGHRIVGAIADFVLSANYPDIYKNKILKLLAATDEDGKPLTRSLSQVAVFADCAKPNGVPFCGRTPSKEEVAYAARNLKHATFHYTDVPLGQATYVADSPGTAKTDVVHMINYAIAKLQKKNPAIEGVNLTDTEALWLLVHLVGDIHQPLHVGAPYYDKRDCTTMVDPNTAPGGPDSTVSPTGGNDIVLQSPEPFAAPPEANLHFFWDGSTVAAAMRAERLAGAEQDFARLLAAKAPDDWQPTGEPQTWAEQWVAEIMPIAKRAYADVTIQSKLDAAGKCTWSAVLDDGYQLWAQETARRQVAKAGFRLAALLVAIFK